MFQRIGPGCTQRQISRRRTFALGSVAIGLWVMAAGVFQVWALDSFALARYTLKGRRDTTFSKDGRVLTLFSSTSDDSARALALQPDGKVVVAGSSNAQGTTDFALVRHNADGSQDTTFGRKGRVLTDVIQGGFEEAFALAI
jgi:uncharacterized delta-60 repeat protein